MKPRPIIEIGNEAVVALHLADNSLAIIDRHLASSLGKYNWSLANGYPSRRRNEDRELVYLHREITGPPPNMEVDHINGNKLDNRLVNLRVVDRLDQMRNTVRSRNRIDISFDRTWNKWKAYIDEPGKKRINVGTFMTRKEAEIALEKAKETKRDD